MSASGKESTKKKSVRESTTPRNRAYLSIYFSDPAERALIERAAELFEMDVSPFVAREMKKLAEKVIEKHEGKCARCGRAA